MKKMYLLVLLITAAVSADSWGVSLMAGGRYDDIRMCVASDAGVKGGPVMDIKVTRSVDLNDGNSLVFSLPVMRPILFAARFDMLQFEPDVTFTMERNLSDKTDWQFGPGLGLSFHYGPDYRADEDNRGEEFFAAGPYISFLNALRFTESDAGSALGVRAFYAPLFSQESDLSPGTVLGGALEYSRGF
ncbi:MAG: hypothetical protein ACQEQV_08415 [Fibrobacterota bacterium]